MKYATLDLLMVTSMSTDTIFDFYDKSNLDHWYIVDDVLMGGRSSGSLALSVDGHGVFSGTVSLENNGGFSSVRHRFDEKSVDNFTHVSLKIKGDGKKYQFRVKAKADDHYSYVYTFPTTGLWEDIQIPIADMFPSFRGRRLNMANFSEDTIEELAFLIGNKKEEKFELFIDKIELK